jgi:hypothetical protein
MLPLSDKDFLVQGLTLQADIPAWWNSPATWPQ